jgi:hypothetical protein
MRRALTLAAIAAALLSAGCGGGTSSNGEASKPAKTIVQDAVAAATAASSVHMKGSIAVGTTKVAVDLRLLADRGGTGTVTLNGVSFDLVRVGDTAYFRGSAAFWKQFAGGAAAQLLQGRWLKASASSGQFAELAVFTRASELFKQLISSSAGATLSSTGETTRNGERVIGVADRSTGSVLYVAARGTPYPVALTRKGSGEIAFDRWNEKVELTAPPDAIDAAERASSAGG